MYADEDFPLETVAELRHLGHDVVTVADRGLARKKVPDDQVLAAAVADDRVVLTENRWDFIRLHRQSAAHAGIVVCTRDSDFLGLAARIDAAVAAAGDLHGQLVRVNRPP
ncbi:MAG TPA: DUF5615 family PIN-like protein [Urbifossiella sp.]|nr:DUF5615 family PIN-like protein [Urbifossiella sp.]